MTFKPAKVETPQSENFGDYAPRTGQPGDSISRPAEPEKSLYTPTELETPQSKNFGNYATGTGQPGDTSRSDRGYRFTSDRPQSTDADAGGKGDVSTPAAPAPERLNREPQES